MNESGAIVFTTRCYSIFIHSSRSHSIIFVSETAVNDMLNIHKNKFHNIDIRLTVNLAIL